MPAPSSASAQFQVPQACAPVPRAAFSAPLALAGSSAAAAAAPAAAAAVANLGTAPAAASCAHAGAGDYGMLWSLPAQVMAELSPSKHRSWQAGRWHAGGDKQRQG